MAIDTEMVAMDTEGVAVYTELFLMDTEMVSMDTEMVAMDAEFVAIDTHRGQIQGVLGENMDNMGHITSMSSLKSCYPELQQLDHQTQQTTIYSSRDRI